mgnify:CR=1 FL=1
MAEVFLSDGWFSQTEKIQNEVNPPVPPAIKDLKINMQVTGGPSGEVAFRMEAGRLVKGHAADAPTKLVIPFDTARAMLIDQNQLEAIISLPDEEGRLEPALGREAARAFAAADARDRYQQGLIGLTAAGNRQIQVPGSIFGHQDWGRGGWDW